MRGNKGIQKSGAKIVNKTESRKFYFDLQ